jgi:hypothetical protein
MAPLLMTPLLVASLVWLALARDLPGTIGALVISFLIFSLAATTLPPALQAFLPNRLRGQALVRSQSRCQRPPIVDVNGQVWVGGRHERQTGDCRWRPGPSAGAAFNASNFARQTLSECESVR